MYTISQFGDEINKQFKTKLVNSYYKHHIIIVIYLISKNKCDLQKVQLEIFKNNASTGFKTLLFL